MVEALRTVVELNRDLIYFAYGLSFFVLGLAIALQSRRASQLELARSLTWLAAFGFVHGFHEWGEYFIPIQAAYLDSRTVAILHAVRLLLLGISFSCLLEFGIRLLRPMLDTRKLSLINAGVFGIWLLVSFLPLSSVFNGEPWRNAVDASARYFLGLPGGILAGYALRRHTYERIVPLGADHIVRWLRTIGLSLFGYAILGGLIPPPVPFFPGNVVNSQWFEALFIVPPAVPRSIVGLILSITTIRALEIFDLETNRRIEEMEQQQLLQAEHSRIARELHDGAIQKVYTAGLLVQSVAGKLSDQETALARLHRAEQAISDAIRDLRHNLRELSPDPSPEPFAGRLQGLVEDPRFGSFLKVRLDLGSQSGWDLEDRRAGHVLAIIHEALTNAVRHAKANEVMVKMRRAQEEILISIEDDGRGLPPDFEAGFGLRNMRDRARLLGGHLQLEPRDESGTRVLLTIPLHEEHP